jgi:hypothetical protein
LLSHIGRVLPVVLLRVFDFAISAAQSVGFYGYTSGTGVFGVAFLSEEEFQLVACFFGVVFRALGEYL